MMSRNCWSAFSRMPLSIWRSVAVAAGPVRSGLEIVTFTVLGPSTKLPPGMSTRVMRCTSIRIENGEKPRLEPPRVSTPTWVSCGSK